MQWGGGPGAGFNSLTSPKVPAVMYPLDVLGFELGIKPSPDHLLQSNNNNKLPNLLA